MKNPSEKLSVESVANVIPRVRREKQLSRVAAWNGWSVIVRRAEAATNGPLLERRVMIKMDTNID